MGADFACIGSAAIANKRARASDACKQAIVDSNSYDIVYGNPFTGVHVDLCDGDVKTVNFAGGEGSKTKAWNELWGCGQGIGAVSEVTSVSPATW